MSKGSNGINIYLAGKIAPGDWRHTLIPTLRRDSGDQYNSMINGESESWPVFINAIRGKHNYTGPYFIGCDHGCYHGDASHGCGAGYGEGYYDHGQCSPGCSDYNPEFQDQKNIVKRCLDAIDRSDLVFAWIDTNDCFGTIFELGYAVAKNKQIVLASPIGIGHDMWFMFASITHRDNCYTCCADDPIQAFDGFLNTLPECESPIEEQFYAKAKLLGLVLVPQYEIISDGHKFRADFAIPSKDIAIEIDGHEYHKTKEQRTSDAKRERALQKEGWQVIRFTGSEVFANCDKCVREVMVLGGLA